jgi:hypothetical protein
MVAAQGSASFQLASCPTRFTFTIALSARLWKRSEIALAAVLLMKVKTCPSGQLRRSVGAKGKLGPSSIVTP